MMRDVRVGSASGGDRACCGYGLASAVKLEAVRRGGRTKTCDGIRNQALSCEYFSRTSRLYSSLTALREICPFRSLAIFRRSGSVGARDFLLNLAKSWLAGPGVLPNSRS